jgi:MinD-like ATPase involved in chromosome partitioning or flagellar assembly
VVFSGPLGGEGTTTILWQTAEILRTVYGLKVLVVEAGQRRSDLSERLHLGPGPTFAELLSGEKSLDQCRRRGPSGIEVIATGVSADPTGMDPSALARVLPMLESESDLVLIDSPPVLDGNECLSILSVVGRLVLVVEASRTRLEVLDRVQREVGYRQGNILGTVLNKQRRVIPRWIYRRLAR